MSCDVGEVTERLKNELYLRHSSFSNPSVASTTSQLIPQPFFRFSYVTGFSLTSSGEPPMIGAPGIFSDLLRSVQMLKREWGAEINGKLFHLFNPL